VTKWKFLTLPGFEQLVQPIAYTHRSWWISIAGHSSSILPQLQGHTLSLSAWKRKQCAQQMWVVQYADVTLSQWKEKRVKRLVFYKSTGFFPSGWDRVFQDGAARKFAYILISNQLRFFFTDRCWVFDT
jgi:hypothetical protein